MMRYLIVILMLLSVLPAAAQSRAQSGFGAKETVRNTIEGFARPGYHAFFEAAGLLEAGMDNLCKSPSSGTLDIARERFRSAAKSYAKVEMLHFGPISEDNRRERLLYWPDRKSLGLKQVQALVANADEEAADATSLAGKSVAVQGFGALEFVLFGTGSDELMNGQTSFRCRYGKAISTNIAAIASALTKGWDDANGFSKTWMEPSATNPVYRDDQEALTEVLDIFVHGLEEIRDVRFNGFLGEEPVKDRPKQALFWRSDLTVDIIRENLVSLRSLFVVSGIGNLLKPDEEWIGDEILFEFDNAVSALIEADGPVAETLPDKKKRDKLAYARIVTSSLSDDFGTRLSAALGITVGFSSLDGD